MSPCEVAPHPFGLRLPRPVEWVSDLLAGLQPQMQMDDIARTTIYWASIDSVMEAG
jgi:hypothetical protein